jgi:hypothetical protein
MLKISLLASGTLMLNKHDLQRIENGAKKDLVRANNAPPEIEEVSVKEVYLLENGHRTSRICGKVDEEGWPCTYEAGRGTLHVGEGRCKRHSSADVGKKAYLKRYISTLNADTDIAKFMAISNKADEDFYSTDRLVRLLDAFLQLTIHNNQYDFTEKKVNHCIDIIEATRRLIETNQKREMNKSIAIAMSVWLRGVMSIISNNVSPEAYSKIVGQMSNIEMPAEITDINFEEVV